MNELTPEQIRILREKGTEAPFSGEFYKHDKKGNYSCADCGSLLFSSETKFDSGSGWPSFSDVIDKGAVKLVDDSSHGMNRVEVQCSKCEGHLGHVFPDGPTETCQRYCINSLALGFKESDEK